MPCCAHGTGCPDRQSVRVAGHRRAGRPRRAEARRRRGAGNGARGPCDRARARGGRRGRGHLRLLGRRRLQRGAERRRTRHAGRLRPRRWCERPVSRARSAARPRRRCAPAGPGNHATYLARPGQRPALRVSAGVGFDAELVRRVDARGRTQEPGAPGTSGSRWKASGCWRQVGSASSRCSRCAATGGLLSRSPPTATPTPTRPSSAARRAVGELRSGLDVVGARR